jgi:hypothetical protein
VSNATTTTAEIIVFLSKAFKPAILVTKPQQGIAQVTLFHFAATSNTVPLPLL